MDREKYQQWGNKYLYIGAQIFTNKYGWVSYNTYRYM